MLDLKADFGAAFDGVTDDTQSWIDASAASKASGDAVFIPAGHSITTETISYVTDGVSDFTQGPRFFAPAGPFATKLIGRGMSNKPLIDIVGLPNKRLAGGKISGLGFALEDCGPGVDAIRYRGLWHSTFEDLAAERMTGSGLRVGNPNSGDTDADASAHITLRNLRVEECHGPAWNADGCAGGVTHHHLDQCYFLNNGLDGNGQVIIDGTIDFRMTSSCIAALNGVDTPLVKIKATHLHSQLIRFEGGEYGNNCGTHFDIDGVVNLQVQGIRQVRRTFENTPTKGFLFRNAGKVHTGIYIYPGNEIAVDDASPAFTWATKEAGATFIDVNVVNPRTTSFAAGNLWRSGF